MLLAPALLALFPVGPTDPDPKPLVPNGVARVIGFNLAYRDPMLLQV
jgi:hypothetical protein